MNYKQKFIEYCKDKIKDLGRASYIDPIWEEEISESVIMISNVRNFKDLKVVSDLDEYDEPLKCIDENGKLLINTRMYDAQMLAADLMFSAIDTEFYHNLIEYWNELPMDEYMKNNEEGCNTQNTIDLEEESNIIDNKKEDNFTPEPIEDEYHQLIRLITDDSIDYSTLVSNIEFVKDELIAVLKKTGVKEIEFEKLEDPGISYIH